MTEAVEQHFRWQAEPVNNDTASASGALELLFATGTASPAATGLSISAGGVISFAANQTFPSTGSVSGTGVVNGDNTNSTGYGVEGTSPNVGVYGSGTGSGGIGVDAHGVYQGVKGISSATSGAAEGVYAQAASSSGYGVYAVSPYVGVFGFTSSTSGMGEYSQEVGASSSGAGLVGDGVWGDTNQTHGTAVQGTADNGYAGYFLNHSDTYATLSAYNNSSATGDVFVAEGTVSGKSCTIDTNGNLTCSGHVTGSVAVENGARTVSLYAVESPENWFEDFGSGKLANGVARVALDPTFAETVNTGVEYHVYITPNAESEGLYVSNKTTQGFEVRESHGGRSNIAFDYRIVAKRSGYESVRLADAPKPPAIKLARSAHR